MCHNWCMEKWVQIRVTVEAARAAKAAAARRGEPLYTWASRALLAAVRRERREPEEMRTPR